LKKCTQNYTKIVNQNRS